MKKPAEKIAKEIVANALEIDQSLINTSAKMYDFPSWDSLGQLKIVLGLESRLGIKIEDEKNFEKLTKFAAIVSLIDEH
jgi:acyl carrier protein